MERYLLHRDPPTAKRRASNQAVFNTTSTGKEFCDRFNGVLQSKDDRGVSGLELVGSPRHDHGLAPNDGGDNRPFGKINLLERTPDDRRGRRNGERNRFRVGILECRHSGDAPTAHLTQNRICRGQLRAHGRIEPDATRQRHVLELVHQRHHLFCARVFSHER